MYYRNLNHNNKLKFEVVNQNDRRGFCILLFLILNIINADIVGMSTAPEVIIAHYLGIKVLALSLVTNKCYEEFPSRKLELNIDRINNNTLNISWDTLNISESRGVIRSYSLFRDGELIFYD